MTALTPLSDKNEINCWENRPFISSWPEPRQEKPEKQEKSKDLKRTIKNKPKRVRTSFSTVQLRLLEKTFSKNKYIDVESRRELASCLKIEDKTIKVWFQNRRMKEKRDSSDSSCDSASECLSNVSPPPSSQAEHQVSESSINQVDSNKMLIPHYETHQYQVPNATYNSYVPTEEYHQGFYNAMPTMSFSYDGNVYPTQYPTAESDYYTNTERSHYYNISNSNENNWPNTFDFGYF